METRDKHNCEFSKPFLLSSHTWGIAGRTPTLFSVLFSSMLTDAYREENVGLSFAPELMVVSFYNPQR